jgi:hypothetical protein
MQRFSVLRKFFARFRSHEWGSGGYSWGGNDHPALFQNEIEVVFSPTWGGAREGWAGNFNNYTRKIEKNS